MTAQTVALAVFAIIVALASAGGAPPADVPLPPEPGVTDEFSGPNAPPEVELLARPLPATVRVGQIHMHELPQGGSPIAQLQQGDPVTVIGAGAETYFVRTAAGAEGYVAQYALRLRAGSSQQDVLILGYYMQGGERSWSTLEANSDALTAISPWSWGLTTDGHLRPVYFTEQHLGEVLRFAGERGLETHALIHNFDPALGAFDTTITDRALGNAAIRTEAVGRIAEAARSWGMTGVHIDFEGVSAARRNDLVTFMKELRQKLAMDNIGLSMAVPAKTFATADSLWTGAYDYRALAAHVDFLMIMAYDLHWPGGPPGPVASLPWVRNVLDYALDPEGGAVPPTQIVLGLPAYGYDWPLHGARPGEAVTFAETSERYNDALSRDPATEVRWHGEHGAPYLDYDGRRIWFENAHSLHFKLELAREYGLRGVAIWRLGQEDPAVWSLLRKAD